MGSGTTNFQQLLMRLLAEIRGRIHNGDLTERSLARLSGISQPHIHNILKGTRYPSTVLADQLLASMRIDLPDLVSRDVGECHRGPPHEGCRLVPLLQGRIGEGEPFPPDNAKHTHVLSVEALVGTEDPAVAILGRDAHTEFIFSEGDLVLLDRSEMRRRDPENGGYWAVDFGTSSAIRRVWRDSDRVYLPSRDDGDDPRCWPSMSCRDRRVLQLIRGRVQLLIHRL